jgi:hypothetical protein
MHVKHASVTEIARVRMRAELPQRACTHGLHLHRLRVCIKAKAEINTGSPDQEEASGIDNQGLLKAWILLPNRKEK